MSDANNSVIYYRPIRLRRERVRHREVANERFAVQRIRSRRTAIIAIIAIIATASTITASTITAPIDTKNRLNQLKNVPTNLAQFVNVTSLSPGTNGLTSIGLVELNLRATVVSLDISNNSISTIATDALPGENRGFKSVFKIEFTFFFLLACLE